MLVTSWPAAVGEWQARSVSMPIAGGEARMGGRVDGWSDD